MNATLESNVEPHNAQQRSGPESESEPSPASSPPPTAAPFRNPYSSKTVAENDWLRVSIDVSRRDVARIRSVTMDWGTMQAALGLFVKYLHDYAESRELTLADRDEFIEHIKAITTVRPAGDSGSDVSHGSSVSSSAVGSTLTGLPSSQSPRQGPDRDDRRGASGVCAPDQSTTNESGSVTRKQARSRTKDNR